ncbi:MAG: electron transport complex protein RnfA [Nanoarchaeota archaeon]
MDNIYTLLISSIFVNNVVLIMFLGICPFIGVSKKTSPAFYMGIAVTLIMVCSSFLTWIIYKKILEKLNLEYMWIVIFIFIIALMVQGIEIFIKKKSISLYQKLGIYLPLITTNCAILGIAFLNITNEFSLLYAVINGFGAGIGFMIALIMMSSIREKLELGNVPEIFKGVPIAFITAAIMSLAFFGFKAFL